MSTDYKDTYPLEIIRLMQDGKSIVQTAASLGISKSTFYNWIQKYPEFAAAKHIGTTLSEAYWEEIGQKGAKGILPKFNAMAWSMLMKARYKEDWTEQTQQKIELVDSVKKMSDDELNKTIEMLLSQKKKKTPTSGSTCPI